ncbi:hypothetical protein ACQ4PT_066219 [Festuca glaucescens]
MRRRRSRPRVEKAPWRRFAPERRGWPVRKRKKKKRVARPSTKRRADASEDHFVGEPIPDDEARQRWPERYTPKNCDSQAKKRSDAEEKIAALRHYRAACVDGAKLDLGDDVYVKAGPGEDNYIGRITELFAGIDHGSYFTCRWFFRVADTVISPKLLEDDDHKHDHQRVFLSEEKNDNMLESIICKVNIIYLGPNITPKAKDHLISNCDLYYDMSYSVPYSSFANMPPENGGATGSEVTSDISCHDVESSKENPIADLAAPPAEQMETATLLDLYSGCGAMSTGLCLGASLSGLKLNTKWAVDMNRHACNSLKHNHPGTQVGNEKAEDFLSLLWQWDDLCKKYDVHNNNSLHGLRTMMKMMKMNLSQRVRWKTYDPSHDTWEPSGGLSDSPERIKEFVESGYRESILPLPGANFRDLKGVRVGQNNTVEFDPDSPRVLLSSGKPLVPSYAMTFTKGKSLKPFGRLWWDETVATVVTRAEPHNQVILHPVQHRVLTIRENARLQGFPDYYRLFGPIKQKYIQVGNVVAVPVARALGYSLGQAYQGEFGGDYPPFKLPGNFIPMDQSTLTRLFEGTSGGELVEAE